MTREISGERLRALKDYLKIDYDDEDETVVKPLYISAVTIAEMQTGKPFDDEIDDDVNQLYFLAIKLIVSHWHANRAMIVTGTIVTEIPFGAKVILDQIALYGGDPETGGGGQNE